MRKHRAARKRKRGVYCVCLHCKRGFTTAEGLIAHERLMKHKLLAVQVLP